MADNELITEDVAGSAYISNFASKVFEGADETDRSGKATRLTAKEFLAASTFFELLSIFGPLDTEVSERITYAKWKATSIAKAFREGRTPTPGPANAAPPADEAEAPSSAMSAGPSGDGSVGRGGVIDLTQEDGHNQGDVDMPSAPFDDEYAPSPSFPSAPFDLPSAPAGENRSNLPAPPTFPSEFNAKVDDDDDQGDDALSGSGILPSAPPFDPSAASTSGSQASALPPPPISAYIPPPQPRQAPPPPAPAPAPARAPATRSATAAATNLARNGPAATDYGAGDDWQPAPSTVDPVTIGTAQKHAKWAISALNYEDLETARKELRAALQLIGG